MNYFERKERVEELAKKADLEAFHEPDSDGEYLPLPRRIVVPTVFRARIMRARNITTAEWQKLVKFFGVIDELCAYRSRALLLRTLGRDSGYVHENVGVSERQYFRWLRWYERTGLKGLLRERAKLYRQCSNCGVLGSSSEHFSRSMSWCQVCDRARKKEWRRSPGGKTTEWLYARSKKRKEARARYRESEKGRATRRREHLKRQST